MRRCARVVLPAVALAMLAPAPAPGDAFYPGSTRLVSKFLNGDQATGWASSITPDGRYVAFTSWDALVAADVDSYSDIYRWDRLTGEIVGVTVGYPSTEPWKFNFPSISADGTRILSAAETYACLPYSSGCLWSTMMMSDLATGAFKIVGGVQGYIETVTLSADGKWAVAVYRHSEGGMITVVRNAHTGGSVVSIGMCDCSAYWASISGDGRYVAYEAERYHSWDATRRYWDAYIYDRDVDGDGIFDEAGQTATTPAIKAEFSLWPSVARSPTISADGSTLIFAGDGALYAKTLATGRIELVSSTVTGEAAAADPTRAVSADGRIVAFTSNAAATLDANPQSDVFVRDLDRQTTSLASIQPDGRQGALDYLHAGISDDGRFVAFTATPYAGTGALAATYLRDRSGTCSTRCIEEVTDGDPL